MFNFMLRNGHLLRGRLSKEKFDMNTSIQDFRDRCEKGASRYSVLPQGLKTESCLIAGMKSEWLKPEGAGDENVIMYVHGGGYVSGSCNDHRSFVSKFAGYIGVTALMYEYRLAPEHPYPAALEDSVKIYHGLLDSGYRPENIVMAGESAGGGLCLATLLALRDRDFPLPAAAVAISPWTDLSCSSESYKTRNRVSPAPLNSWNVFSRHYCGDQPANLPYISPLFGDLKGLPPLYINSGEWDELYEDGEKFAIRAQEAGVEVIFRKGERMLHCYPLLAPMFPEAVEAMEEIVSFVRYRLRIN